MPTHIPLKSVTHIMLKGVELTGGRDVSQESRIPAGQPNAGEWMDTAGEEAAYADEWKKKLANDDAIDYVPLLDENAEKPRSVENYAYGKVKAVLKADPSLAMYGITPLFPQPDLSDAGLEALTVLGDKGDKWYSKWRSRLASHDVSSIPGMTARKLSRVFGVMGDGTSPRDDYAYTLRAMDRLRHDLWRSPEDVEMLEKDGLLGKFGTYGIDPEEIDGAIHDQPLPRVINTRTGLTNKKLGVDYSKATDFRKLYNYTQGVLGKGGVAVDVWMTRMFFRADTAPNRYQYDYVEGRVKHMAEVLSKKTGKPYSSEDVQAMLWVGYKGFIANKLKGYQEIIRAHGNDAAKKLLKPLDAAVEQSMTPGDADSIITYSGMMKDPDVDAAYNKITGFDENSSREINPIPYLTVHKVIEENRDALVKLIDDDTVKNGYAGHKDIFGNINAAIEIYKAHLDEFDEKHISLEYSTSATGERVVSAVGAKGEIAKMFRSFMPKASVFEIKSSKTKGTNIDSFKEGQIGFGYTYGNKSVAGVADPEKMKAAMEADPKLKAGLLLIAGMLKTKAKAKAGHKSDDLGTALGKMAQFAGLTYPHEVPKGIGLSYEPEINAPGILDGSLPVSGDPSAAIGRNELRKGAGDDGRADEAGGLHRGIGRRGSAGSRLDVRGRDADLGRGGSVGQPERVGSPAQTILIKGLAEARIPKGQPHGGEWAKGSGGAKNEYADKRMDVLPLHSISHQYETAPLLGAMFGYAAQPEYPPITSRLENRLLMPAPPHAPTVLAKYLSAHNIDFEGILPEIRPEYRPDLVGLPNSVTGVPIATQWDGLTDVEKAGRVAASTLQAFDAMESVIRVDGTANPAKNRLNVIIEDLQKKESKGSVLGGSYDPVKNLLSIDLTAADSLIHEFGHYLDTSANAGLEPASHVKTAWLALAQSMNDTYVHEHFAQNVVAAGASMNYIQTPTEMIARLFEGYVMHETLKRGVDIAPAFISPMRGGIQPTLATAAGRELLNFEPYTYQQYEEFGGTLMGLLRSASLTKGLGLDNAVLVLVDSLVKSAHDVSGESRGTDGQWVRGSGIPRVPPTELAQAYSKAVQSSAFKAWFGDWDTGKGSKVKGKDGKPAVNTHTHSVVEEGGVPVTVFHGTANGGFTAFDKAKLDPGALWGAGFYFTQDEGVGTSYKDKDAYRINLTRKLTETDLKKVLASLETLAPAWASAPTDWYERESLRSLLSQPQMDSRGKVALLTDYLKRNESHAEEIAKWLGVSGGGSTAELKKAFLNIRNPLDIDVPIGEAGLRSIADAWNSHGGSSAIGPQPKGAVAVDNYTGKPMLTLSDPTEGHVDIPLYATGERIYEVARSMRRDGEDVSGVLTRMGFDGITHIGGGRVGKGNLHRVWIAWEPNQIKAVENEGAFDPANADMYKGALVKSAHDVSGESRDDNGKWVKGSGAPQVPPAELSQAYSKAIQLPAFKAWFGNWDEGKGSKVKTEDGKPAINTHTHSVVEEGGVPVVVFHGTANGGFTAFDKAKLDPGALWGAGFYFTQDMGVGTSYKEKGGTKVELSRPIDTDDLKKVLISLRRRPTVWATTPISDFEVDDLDSMLSDRHMDDEGKANILEDYIKSNDTYSHDIAAWLGVTPLTSGPELKKAFLNIRNPIDIDVPIGEAGLREIKEYLQGHKERTYISLGATSDGDTLEFTIPEINNSVRITAGMSGQDLYHAVNKAVRIAVGRQVITQDENGVPSVSPQSVFHRMGFDGITHIGGDRMGNGDSHRVWIAWEPNQVKAVENEGTFDPASEDMYKGLSLVILSKSAHDVSGEKRDTDGKWVRGSGIPRVPPTELAQAYSKAVQSKAFKAWFGDWDEGKGSKVKTEDGKPAVNTHTHSVVEEGGVPVTVFHGTSHGGFRAFDKSKLDPGALWGAGFYFTQDMGVGTSYKEKGDVRAVIANTDAEVIAGAEKYVLANKDSDRSIRGIAINIQNLLLAYEGDRKAAVLRSYFERNPFPAREAGLTVNRPPTELKKAFLNIRNPLDIDRKIGMDGLKSIAAAWNSKTEKTPMLEPAASFITPGGGSKTYLNLWQPGGNGKTTLTENFTGSDIYDALANAAPEDQTYTEVLTRMGFDGITHIGGDRVGNGNSHRVWIAWEPNQIKAVENEGTFDPANPDMYKGLSLVVLAKGLTPHLSHMAYAGGLHNSALVRSACQHVNETEVGIKGKDGKLIACTYCPDCLRVKSVDKSRHGHACNDAPLDVADMQEGDEQGGDSLRKGHDVSGEARGKDGQWQRAGKLLDSLHEKYGDSPFLPDPKSSGSYLIYPDGKVSGPDRSHDDMARAAYRAAGLRGSQNEYYVSTALMKETGVIRLRDSHGETALEMHRRPTDAQQRTIENIHADATALGNHIYYEAYYGQDDAQDGETPAFLASVPWGEPSTYAFLKGVMLTISFGGEGLRKAADPKAADLKDTDASGKAVKTGAKKPGDVSEDCYKNPESCQLKWITAHPDGELGRGVPLLVHDNGEEYTVVGGAGGKLNQLVFKKPTAQQTIDKKGKNVEREKMKQQRILAAREQLGDKGVELEQRKAALDTQAKEQLKGIQNKALAKMGIQFEGSDAVKAITDEARARAIKLNPNASPEEQEQLANAAVKQARSDAKDAVKRLTQHALDRAAMRSLGVADGGDSEKFAADIAGRKILKDMSNEDLDDFVGDIAALSQTKAMSRAVTKVLNSGRASAIDGIVASVQPISDEDAKKQNLAQYLDGRSVNVNTALVRGSELASPATQHRLQAMSASDAINSIVSEHTGQAILGPETIQALGIENSARVAAAYLVKHGNSGKAIGDALEQQVATGAYAAESAALSQVDELNVIVSHAKDSAGVGTVTQNQASIVAANMAVQSYRILNTCRGQIRATSGVAHFLESGLGGDLELPVGGTLSEGRAQAKAFGLQDGDFDIRAAQTGEGGGYILHVAEDKLDKLAQPHDAGASARSADMDRLRADVEASPGHYTPQGWNTAEGGPTLAPYQELATRGILQNKHLLLNYGAGVGKTPIYLAAAMDALATGKVDRVLMTSPQKPLSQLIKGDDDKPNGEAGFFLSPEAGAQIAVVSGGASLKAALEDLKSGKKKMIAMTPVTMRDHMDELKAAGFGGEKSMYIADEAHYFATGAGEGKGSAMARSAREMAGSEYAVYGTGSAVDNDGSELHSLYNDLHPGELGPQKAFASEWLRLSGGSSNLHEGMAMRGMRDRLSGGMLSEFKPVTDKKTGREIKLTNTDKPVTLYPEQVEAIKVINAQYLVDKKSPDSGKATAAALVRDAHKRAVMDNGVPGADGKMRSAKGDAADEIARSEKAINPQNRIGIYSQTLAPARNAADKIIQSGTMKNFVSITGAEDEAATRKSLAALNDRTNDTDGVILSDAANLGVNGQGMDNIVKMGPMLTAGRENQLNHRHYRKGQTRDVRTTTLIANDPLDEIAQYRVKNTKGKQFALLASMMDDTGVAGLLTQHLDTIMKVAGSGDAAGKQPNT